MVRSWHIVSFLNDKLHLKILYKAANVTELQFFFSNSFDSDSVRIRTEALPKRLKRINNSFCIYRTTELQQLSTVLWTTHDETCQLACTQYKMCVPVCAKTEEPKHSFPLLAFYNSDLINATQISQGISVGKIESK